ncbi:hypothetical protein FSP39_017863 [Pinctada imbricata]|uniref:Uncharacterized protein n=1 Tax=Pinctada imbricata TaxID=66713 RepID=A0AA89BS74_PINIB|nr:hypothetical protein FSP39_017863 [Pinctada imbricata]
MLDKYTLRCLRIKRCDAFLNRDDHSYAAKEIIITQENDHDDSLVLVKNDEDYDEISTEDYEQSPETSHTPSAIEQSPETSYTPNAIEQSPETSHTPSATDDVIYVPEIGETVDISTSLSPYQQLRVELLLAIERPYYMNCSVADIQICENYSTDNPAIKLCVIIRPDFTAQIYVHRLDLSENHEIWNYMPHVFNNVSCVKHLLSKVQSFHVCIGNPEEQFQDLIPIPSDLDYNSSQELIAFRESDFGAVNGSEMYNSTIRTFQCALLVQGRRCSHCSTYRRSLFSRLHRLEKKDNNKSRIGRGMKHNNFRHDDFVRKINEQKEKIKSLETEMNKMRQQYYRDLKSKGILMDKNINKQGQDSTIAHDDVR